MDTALPGIHLRAGEGGKQPNPAKIQTRKPKIHWNEAEDQQLISLVQEHGTGNWKVIADQIPGRSNKQCRIRWFDSLDPSKKSGHWTREEKQQLINLVQQNGTGNWPAIATQIAGRTPKQCRDRWLNSLNPSNNKGAWTREEDQQLINFVEQEGTGNWPAIAAQITGRTPKQCRHRWLSSLNPSKNREPWTQEEDKRLVEQFQKMGSKWAQIAKFFPDRIDSDLRNRWVNHLSKINQRRNQLTTVKSEQGSHSSALVPFGNQFIPFEWNEDRFGENKDWLERNLNRVVRGEDFGDENFLKRNFGDGNSENDNFLIKLFY
ncbi:MAG: hypothetical protein LBI77_01100 [Puniceicoccales bacterium]|nr:hypothetical protein [Puniceicoccales bacterium]